VQVSCPQCAQKIGIDDAKVPDRPFSVKCPKCQAIVKLPGKTAAPPAGEPPAPAPAAPAAEEIRAQMMAQLRRELAHGEGVRAGGRAMIALGDHAQAEAIAAPLGRLGYTVDTLDNPDEGARLLEQGVYDLVVGSQAAIGGGRESLYERVCRLSSDARRRIFLVLVGDEFKTGEGTQAWASMADLVVHPRDIAGIDVILMSTLGERTRLYQVYLDVRRRFEESAV